MRELNSYRLFHFGLLLVIYLSLPAIAWSGIVVVNGLSHMHSMKPGETQKGQIEVQNAKTNSNVRAYQRDYVFYSTGEAFYEEAGSRHRSNAKWIEVNPAFITLESEQLGIINYQVTVPKDESLFGTYWSVIMIEEVAPLDANKLEKGVTINTLIRYAVQIAVTIGDHGTKELVFTKVEVVPNQGKKVMYVEMENKGDFFLRPNLVIELFDANGNAAGTFSTPKKRTYPGTSVRFEVEVEGVKPGSYQAMILADCSEDDVFGINLTVAVKDD